LRRTGPGAEHRRQRALLETVAIRPDARTEQGHVANGSNHHTPKATPRRSRLGEKKRPQPKRSAIALVIPPSFCRG
jgi:hypothetical protein